MPLLFSYGTLQQEDVQRSTLARTLDGHSDELIGFAPSRVKIDDARVAATLGMTPHANVTRSADDWSRVAGMVYAHTPKTAENRHVETPAVTFRHAVRDDVPAIVRLLADDPLGANREHNVAPLPEAYYSAFDAIDRDPNNELIVVESEGHTVVGVLQLTFIPGITYRGGWRALIEGVRIAAELRSSGVGKRLFEWAIARARARGCHVVQLTSDKSRADAIRFYERLGFVASHEGLKLHLPPAEIR